MGSSGHLFNSLEIRREYLHKQIAHSIQEMIAENQLQPGARLPSERDLAQQLGVSRATVSEAIRSLEQRGLILRRVGDGTYITDKTRSVFVESMGWLFTLRSCTHEDLMTFREMIEPDIAALAAERATPEDLATIKAYLDQTEEAWDKGDTDRHVAADAHFHEALSLATHNELVIAVVAGIQNVLRSAINAQHRASSATSGQVKARDAMGIRSHRPIQEAIAARDPVRARRAMEEHMQLTRLAMEKALVEPAPPL
jgi:GntR family transcriptional repressor for pyruvate dehydrogenase complex